MSTPKRTFLTGLLFGALAIGAFALQSSGDKRSADQSSVERNGTSASGELDKTLTGTLKSDTAPTSGSSDDGVAQTLQVVRDSLQRNDLASAKVLLGAVQTLHKDDDRALTLQKELQAREGKADASPPVTRADKPPDTSKSTRSTSRSSTRADRSRTTSFPVREHAINTSRHSPIKTAPPQVKISQNGGVSANIASPAPEIGRAAATSLVATPAETSAPSESEIIRTTPPSEEAVQRAKSNLVPTESDQDPKTRAQVRSELDRARSDGTIPRFGNPDPAGPGGSPSTTANTKTPPGSE